MELVRYCEWVLRHEIGHALKPEDSTEEFAEWFAERYKKSFLQWYYGMLVERYGEDSFEARFYLKYADSWYPKSWTNEQLEKELTRPSKNWSRKMLEAFASTVSKE